MDAAVSGLTYLRWTGINAVSGHTYLRWTGINAVSGHTYLRWTGINAVSAKYDCSGVDRTGQHILQVSSPCSDTARGQPTAEAVGTH